MADNRKEGLEDRLKRLGSQLSEKRREDPKYAADEARAAENRKGYQVAVKLSSEFVAAIIVGALLGYLLDRFAGTGPWGMIVLLLLGFCAGVLNVLRSAGMVAAPRPVDLSGKDGKNGRDGA
ncbi:AtpZ/AtpI family protein [Rhizobium sp. Root482]|uniref:AtpZ/AtpI family protein n=1 Tax=Rhizobium sp. Root482 TaxID=1736543 RepID=UPI0006FFEC04|nr:AtpZ/AtpI family protein [Rhizobium sp. Root482]KQY19950.1 ATP synthase [Rhizobium sp. Root482]